MIGTPEAPRGINAMLGAAFVSHMVKHDPAYDFMAFDPERDLAGLAAASQSTSKENPDISRFLGRGGKLLLWHGFNDNTESPSMQLVLNWKPGQR